MRIFAQVDNQFGLCLLQHLAFFAEFSYYLIIFLIRKEVVDHTDLFLEA